MFGSIITLAFATMRITLWKEGRPDLETSQHYGNTLASLRTALSTEEGVGEDATIMAILALIRTEVVPCYPALYTCVQLFETSQIDHLLCSMFTSTRNRDDDIEIATGFLIMR